MKILNDETKHYRKVLVIIDRLDLERLIAREASKISSCVGECKVSIEEVTEGSPPYKVGYKALVTIIKDLTKNENN